MTRALKPCGTTAAYMRHWRRREDACTKCKAAKRDESAGNRAAVARIRKGGRP